MRKIASSYIFAGDQPPIKNGILVCEDDGTIIDIIDKKETFREEAGVEFYSGILVPGFINTHCHLELSHLKGKINEHLGIAGFIGKINTLRNEEPENINRSIQVADKKMWAAGISAVGDISNSVLSLETKRQSKIYYHTFVEAFGFHPSRAERAFNHAKKVSAEFRENHIPASIVPHSPYSVSEPLFKAISENASDEKSILCIHNQESKGEAEFFLKGKGPIADHLQFNLGLDTSHWRPAGQTSLSFVISKLPAENQLILVHNTFTQKTDIETLKKKRLPENTFLALCPNSNLYIEDQLPPVNLFKDEGFNICFGTDSLASNHQLSVLSELITVQLNFPDIELMKLFTWATLNGAKALNIEKTFGSFEPGKKPGVNLVSGIDFERMKLTERSKVKRLI